MIAPTFHLIGEPLALDLVNTRVRPPRGEETDLLDTPEALHAWLAHQRDRLAVPDGPIDLDAVRRLRDHIAEAVNRARAGDPPPDAALRAITDAQRGAPAYRRVAWDGRAVTGRVVRSGNPTRDLLAALAEAATDLLTDPAVRAVRRCAGHQCRLLFLPANPRRRWCSPALCGNRARVARYYQRHKP